MADDLVILAAGRRWADKISCWRRTLKSALCCCYMGETDTRAIIWPLLSYEIVFRRARLPLIPPPFADRCDEWRVALFIGAVPKCGALPLSMAADA